MWRSFKDDFANWLTGFRVIAPIAIFFLLYADRYHPDLAMPVTLLIIYTAACITDLLDGWWARNIGRTTVLGKIFDPVGDKLLILVTMFGLLMSVDFIYGPTAVAFVVVVFREILVGGFRAAAAETNIKMKTTKLGKWKTVFQMVALGLLIFGGSLQEVGEIATWFAALLTGGTGISYLVQAWPSLSKLGRRPTTLEAA